MTPARDQQSFCHWLTLRPAQRLFWDAMTLLLLSFIKVAMGTIAFFMLAERCPNCQPPHSSDETTQTQILPRNEERKQTNNTVAYSIKYFDMRKRTKENNTQQPSQNKNKTAPLGCYQFVSVVLYAKHSLNTEGMGRKSTCTLHIVCLDPF